MDSDTPGDEHSVTRIDFSPALFSSCSFLFPLPSPATGEKLWHMPLCEESYGEALKSKIADLANIGGKGGGSITAALFLKEFGTSSCQTSRKIFHSQPFRNRVICLTISLTGGKMRLQQSTRARGRTSTSLVRHSLTTFQPFSCKFIATVVVTPAFESKTNLTFA